VLVAEGIEDEHADKNKKKMRIEHIGFMWNRKIPPGLCIVLFILLTRMNFWFTREITRGRKTGSLFRIRKKGQSLKV
jgi:hypothetical protein